MHIAHARTRFQGRTRAERERDEGLARAFVDVLVGGLLAKDFVETKLVAFHVLGQVHLDLRQRWCVCVCVCVCVCLCVNL